MKYYVFSGPLKAIISANSPKDAALLVLQKFGKGKLLDIYVYVSEKGYKKDITFLTNNLLKENL